MAAPKKSASQKSAATKAPRNPAATDSKTKVTVKGITVFLDGDAMDDVQFVKNLRALQRGENELLVWDIIETMLGADQLDEVCDKLKDPATGRCRMSDLGAFLEEIFNKLPK